MNGPIARWRIGRILGMVAALAMLGALVGYLLQERLNLMGWISGKLRGEYTVAQRLDQFGAAAAARLSPYFAAVGLPFPPDEAVFVAIKDQKILEVFGRRAGEGWRFVRAYPVLGASGSAGPKLREGDRQVPEGIYRIVFLNPNSLYHVSLRLDYPNAFDRAMGTLDGRTNLGSDIMIHGKTASVGCLALGDEAAEDLFALVALIQPAIVSVVVAPTDFRQHSNIAPPQNAPPWTSGLYRSLSAELANFPKPG